MITPAWRHVARAHSWPWLCPSGAARIPSTMEDANPSGHTDGQVDMPTLVNGWAKHPSVLQRYYTTFSTSNGQNLHVHSNGCATRSNAYAGAMPNWHTNVYHARAQVMCPRRLADPSHAPAAQPRRQRRGICCTRSLLRKTSQSAASPAHACTGLPRPPERSRAPRGSIARTTPRI